LEADRGQWVLLPECLDDFIDESNPVSGDRCVCRSKSSTRSAYRGVRELSIEHALGLLG
jgi:hypothetical protein